MSTHNSKQKVTQVETLDNKNDDVDYILIRKKLRGSDSFTNDDPNDYAQIKDLEGLNDIIGSIPRKSAQIAGVPGTSTVQSNEWKGKFIDWFNVSGFGEYTVGNAASDANKTATFDNITGTATFPFVFFEDSFVWAYFKDAVAGTTYSSIPIVQNYEDIVTHVLWGGNRELTFYVLTDFQNMGGKKGAYKYIPNFTDTPAQIAINFND